MEKLLFELMKVAVGQLNCLSHTPTADEWRVLYGMAAKQAVLGVCFKGVERLRWKHRLCYPDSLLSGFLYGGWAKIEKPSHFLH